MAVDSVSGLSHWPALPCSRGLMVPVLAAQAPGLIARDVADRLRSALTRRGRALLCVSGGRSPIALFEALSREDLDWSRVQVSLADERCVAQNHPDSNAALVRRHLLKGRAAQAQAVGLMAPGMVEPAQARDAAAWAEQARRADAVLREIGPADVLILGLGLDGHTASIFPRMAAVSTALDPQSEAVCLPVEPECLPAGLAHPRLTQTLAHLLKSAHVVLPVGPDKLAVLRLACEAVRDDLPISQVLHQTITPITVWICHEA